MMKKTAVLFFVICIAALAGCGLWSSRSQEPVRTRVVDASDEKALRAAYSGAPETWPLAELSGSEPPAYREMDVYERTSPKLQNAHKWRALGEALFFDPILSADQDISCATCHAPETAFAKPERSSTGHRGQVGNRNAPVLLDVASSPPFFWDGRAATLEEQAIGPILNPIEMAANRQMVENRLRTNTFWRENFSELIGETPVRLEHAAKAIAEYERSLTDKTRFDRFLEGDETILSEQEILGLHLFRTKARCMTCHNGPELTDGQFHNIGLTYYGRKFQDLGLYEVTRKPADVGAFNTPSLRHISKSGPYMHNGLFPHLKGVVNYYNGGGARPKRREKYEGDPLFPTTTDKLVKLELTKEERAALVAFLKTL